MAVFDVSGPSMLGVWNYGSYLAHAVSAGERRASAVAAREREQRARESAFEFDERSVGCAALGDAMDAICAGAARLAAGPVSSADALVWLWLYDMLVASARLTCAPEVRSRDGRIGVADALTTVACALDAVAATTMGDEGLTVDERRRVQLVYLDLMSRHQAVWIDFVDDMGREAALLAGADWDGAREEYANERRAQLVRAVDRACGGLETGINVALATLSCASAFDADGVWSRRGVQLMSSLRGDIASELALAWPEGATEVSGVRRVFMLPRAVADDTDAYLARLRERGYAA